MFNWSFFTCSLLYLSKLFIISFLSFSVITNVVIYNEVNPEFQMIGICIDYGSLNSSNKSMSSIITYCTFDIVNYTYQDFEY